MATEVSICNLALSLVGAGVISALAESGSKETIECNRWYAHCRDAVLRDHDWNFASKRLDGVALREIGFDAGSTAAPAVGATITAASGETAVVVYVYLESGTFAGTDAAGKFIVSTLSDVFVDNEAITWEGGSAVCNESSGMGVSDYEDYTYSYQYPSDCLAMREILDQTGALTGTSTDFDPDRSVSTSKIEFEIISHESLALTLILTEEYSAKLRYTAQVTTTTLFDQLFVDCLARRLATELAWALRKDQKLRKELMGEYMLYLGKAKSSNANESHKESSWVSSFQTARN